MTVQIKPLRGFSNPINNESNTLSLLVKSDYDLYEHLSKAKGKLISSLTCILNHFKDSEINFYHKIQIKNKKDSIYMTTKCYKSSLNSLKRDIDDSMKYAIDICPNSYMSHFVNIFAKKDGNTIMLNNDKFNELNHIIRSSISHINNDQYLLVRNIPFEGLMMKIESSNAYIKKQTKIVNKRYLSVLKQHIEYLTL